MTDRLRDAVYQVLEGFTLPDPVRKILEAAYYSEYVDTQGADPVLYVGSKVYDGSNVYLGSNVYDSKRHIT